MQSGKSVSAIKKKIEHIPFKHFHACPECGRVELKIVHDQKYPVEEGIVRLVIYRCPNGHETKNRQLVARAVGFPPKKLWEGYY